MKLSIGDEVTIKGKVTAIRGEGSSMAVRLNFDEGDSFADLPYAWFDFSQLEKLALKVRTPFPTTPGSVIEYAGGAEGKRTLWCLADDGKWYVVGLGGGGKGFSSDALLNNFNVLSHGGK